MLLLKGNFPISQGTEKYNLIKLKEETSRQRKIRLLKISEVIFLKNNCGQVKYFAKDLCWSNTMRKIKEDTDIHRYNKLVGYRK